MVDLDDERDAVGVLPRDRAEHAERRRDGVAAALDRELHDVLGIEDTSGFGANDAPAECSMPWSTGKIDT